MSARNLQEPSTMLSLQQRQSSKAEISEGDGVHSSASCQIKRVIDIMGALIGIVILALLIVPIAVVIKLESPGPVFFSQNRYGLKGRKFTLWKFRSMVHNAEALKGSVANQAQGFVFKNESDPRVTRVGKFLRRTSLDEWPQFWNVLKGDMSLVGTRPPTHDEVCRYSSHHWRRLDVKPGLTGQWQINGRSSVKDFEDIGTLDLEYQAVWSPSYDIWVILKTIVVLLNRSGAF